MKILESEVADKNSPHNLVNVTTSEENDYKKTKLRFKEVFEERKYNLEWRDKNQEENILYTEIKENEINAKQIAEAKEKELDNLKHFNVFEEVDDDDKNVIGSRYVLTEKPDGSVKTRFVVKGFQEHNTNQADSPTAGRESLKVFCTICANECWEMEASDVRSAFLQSEELNRDVFIKPPPELQKPNKVWKLKKPL